MGYVITDTTIRANIRPETTVTGTNNAEDWDFRYDVLSNGNFTVNTLGGDDIIHSHSSTSISQTVNAGDGNDKITTYGGLRAKEENEVAFTCLAAQSLAGEFGVRGGVA